MRARPVLWVLLLLQAGCSSPPTGEGIRTARFGDFIFQYPAGEEAIVRILGERSRQIEERVMEDLGPLSLGTVRVRIAAAEQEFLDAWPGTGRPQKWAAAVASPQEGRIVMKSPRLLLGSRETYEIIFMHEVAHIALHRAMARSPGAAKGAVVPDAPYASPLPEPRQPEIPLWLHEGYAQVLARQWSPSQELLLTRAVLRKDLIPLGSLVRGFPTDANRARLAYAESADLVHYLIRRYGREEFHRFLSALGEEASFGAACRQVFQEDFFTLEDSWRRHLQIRYTWFPLLASTGTLWFLTTVVFLLAYLRKRISNRKKIRQWSQQDPL